MTEVDRRSSAERTARWVFLVAGLYGLLSLTPFWFAEPLFAEHGSPITHPEHYYGFVGAASVMQLIYLMVASDPPRFRPIMPLGVVAKLLFALTSLLLWGQGRLEAPGLAFGAVDAAIGLAFLAAWLSLRRSA